MLAQRLRRWPNIKTSLFQRVVFAGNAILQSQSLYFNPFSAGTVFKRQILTYVDVRFWRIKTVPALKKLKYF